MQIPHTISQHTSSMMEYAIIPRYIHSARIASRLRLIPRAVVSSGVTGCGAGESSTAQRDTEKTTVAMIAKENNFRIDIIWHVGAFTPHPFQRYKFRGNMNYRLVRYGEMADIMFCTLQNDFLYLHYALEIKTGMELRSDRDPYRSPPGFVDWGVDFY